MAKKNFIMNDILRDALLEQLPVKVLATGGNIKNKSMKKKRLASGGAAFTSSNAFNIMKLVGGAAITATGNPAIGLPLGISGVTGLAGDLTDEESQVYNPPVSKESQLYQTPLAYGGKISRTDYEGFSHEDGGISMSNAGVELEGGETRTGDMVHSERVKLNRAMFNYFINKIPLKKGDIGKSISDIVKSRDKGFEMREGDKWNDIARKATQKPFEIMSEEISEVSNELIEQDVMMGATGFNFEDLSSMEYAPVSANIGLGIAEALTPVEKVDYEQAKFTPTKVSPVDTSAGIGRIKRSFGNIVEKRRRLNPRGYMKDMINIGAAETEAIGDLTSKANVENARLKSRAYAIDSSKQGRLSMFNSQLAAREAEANAANRAKKASTVSTRIASAATQAGQIARDDKLFTAQDEQNQALIDLYNKRLNLDYGTGEEGTAGLENEIELLNPEYNAQDNLLSIGDESIDAVSKGLDTPSYNINRSSSAPSNILNQAGTYDPELGGFRANQDMTAYPNDNLSNNDAISKGLDFTSSMSEPFEQEDWMSELFHPEGDIQNKAMKDKIQKKRFDDTTKKVNTAMGSAFNPNMMIITDKDGRKRLVPRTTKNRYPSLPYKGSVEEFETELEYGF